MPTYAFTGGVAYAVWRLACVGCVALLIATANRKLSQTPFSEGTDALFGRYRAGNHRGAHILIERNVRMIKQSGYVDNASIRRL